MKDLFYLNHYFVRHKGRFIFGILFIILSNYFRVLQPQMVRHAFDLVVENIHIYRLYDGFETQKLVFAGISSILLIFGVLVFVLAVLMGVFMYFMRQTMIVMSRLIENDLREDIFKQYERLDTAFYRRNNTGDLMARITEDVAKVRMYLGPAIMYAINLVILFVIVIYAMLEVSPILTFYSLLPLPLLSVSIYYVSQQINRKSEIIQKQLAVLNVTAQEVYSGVRVVKSYSQEEAMKHRFAAENEVYKNKSLSLTRIDASFYPIMILLIGASTLLTIYMGGTLVMSGQITAGNIAEFVIYVNMLTWPVTSIGWVASLVQRAAASQKRINEFLKQTPSIQNPTTEKMKLVGEIEFKNVSFVYPDTGIKAIENLSFKLRKGEKMAIIGRTASGKTTIAELILRMYDVTEGEILIDNKNIKDWNIHELRDQMGYVPQDVFLFSETVNHNISFKAKNKDQANIEQYAKYASVYDDVMSLDKGFDTIVGERGVMLSGGQKQRISIARTLIKQPSMLILDDCLSAVDANTEKIITDYLSENLASETLIIITHRIYTSLEFDKIMVLNNGKMVEFGTHQELVDKRGYYAEIFEQEKTVVEET